MHLYPSRTARSLAAPVRHTIAVVLIAISTYPTSASSQNAGESATACPTASAFNHQHLQGRWLTEWPLPGAPSAAPGLAATLQLGPHPELAHSVRGTVEREGVTAQVSGDIDDGELTLEESINGTNISATWTGQVVDGSCGKEIRGLWNNAQHTTSAPTAPPDQQASSANATPPVATQAFVLRKQAGWK